MGLAPLGGIGLIQRGAPTRPGDPTSPTLRAVSPSPPRPPRPARSCAGQQPPASVAHTVSLGGFTGRQTILAVWNIADTANAFYSCIDVQIGGGGGGNSTAAATARTPLGPDLEPDRGVRGW
ncbi:hypothetical protein GCM10023322_57560 [Rugosimonospora acidiphila]|uniref:Chitin-binding type-4 domain-containing protein n=1 Tax=Rugosimonospora acidiphila TaxID=556531 RepID=A0ABP9SDF2_9ACTN